MSASSPILAPLAALPPKPAPSPAAPPPREGAYREVGTVRHASVHALRYRLAGTGKILGEVDVEEANLDGMFSVGRGMTADRVSAKGSLEVGSDLAVREELFVRGSLRVAGKLAAGSADLDGVCHVEKDVSIRTALSFRGTLEVGGAVETALFSPDGCMFIEGTLTAREISGKFDGASRVETLKATNVVLRPKAFVRFPIDVPALRPTGSLQIGRIEADSVNLEGVTVHYLQAPTIVLGRNCHVTQVDGRVVRRDRTSHVGFESRSPPPPGLSR